MKSQFVISSSITFCDLVTEFFPDPRHQLDGPGIKIYAFCLNFSDFHVSGHPKTPKTLVLSCVSQKNFLFHNQSTRQGSLKDSLAFWASKVMKLVIFWQKDLSGSIEFLGHAKEFFARKGLFPNTL